MLETVEGYTWPGSVSLGYHKSVDQGSFSLEPVPRDLLPPLPLADLLSPRHPVLIRALQPHRGLACPTALTVPPPGPTGISRSFKLSCVVPGHPVC